MLCVCSLLLLLKSCSCLCSKFYVIVREKPCKYDNEDSIPMEAIYSTHKVIILRLLFGLLIGMSNSFLSVLLGVV